MNQWVQTPGCCGIAVVGGPIAMEAVTVTGPNQAAPLACVYGSPDGNFLMLVINGMVFLSVGTPPPFIVSSTTNGSVIVWQSTIYGFNVGDSVACAYSYGGSVG